jgi:hypothetical protein
MPARRCRHTARYHFTRLRRCLGFGLKCPPDRANSAFIFPGELLHRLALGVAIGNGPHLASIKPRRPPKLRPLALGPLNTFLAALADQAALKLGNAAHNRQHQPANGGDIRHRADAAGERNVGTGRRLINPPLASILAR